MDKTKILIIDDDEDDFLITSDCIVDAGGHRPFLEWANSYEQGLARIKASEHDIFIVDYNLGAKNGINLIKEAMEAQCEEPMILLTGMNSLEVDNMAAKIGAFDYILKEELNPERIGRSIRYSLAQARSQKALRENENRYRAIFENSKDFNFFASTDYVLTSVSKSAKKMLDYSQEELVGMPKINLFASPDVHNALKKELVEKGEASRKIVQLKTKSGLIKPCSIYTTMQQDRHGNTYIQGVISDLSAEIMEQRANTQTEKMAATERLVRMLAHEVRNPLTNISLSVEELCEELEGQDDKQELIEIIQRNTTRIGNLITDLLNSSRPTEMKLEPMSLQTFLQNVLSHCKDRLKLKEIELQTDFISEHDTVALNAEKLNMAFANFIVNAIEAMKAGKGKLKLSTKIRGVFIVTSITDNGSGISPEHLNQLFEPYFTSKPGGMGLGLAASHNIIQGHGGTINVESVLGKGTTFYVALPLVF